MLPLKAAGEAAFGDTKDAICCVFDVAMGITEGIGCAGTVWTG